MTEQEYMDVTDLARLYAIQKLTADCNDGVQLIVREVTKAIKLLQIKTKDVINDDR